MTATSSECAAFLKPGPLFLSVTSPQPIIPQRTVFIFAPFHVDFESASFDVAPGLVPAQSNAHCQAFSTDRKESHANPSDSRCLRALLSLARRSCLGRQLLSGLGR